MGDAAWACESSCFANNPQPDVTEGLGELEIKTESLRFVVCVGNDLFGRQRVQSGKPDYAQGERRLPAVPSTTRSSTATGWANHRAFCIRRAAFRFARPRRRHRPELFRGKIWWH